MGIRLGRNALVFSVVFSLGVSAGLPASASKLCEEWSDSKKIGTLPVKLIHEASGIAVSASRSKLYHVNDSGDGPHFYETDLTGKNLRKIRITGFKAEDVEDLALGPCGKDQCLFVADIGDNPLKRKTIEIAVIRERNFGTRVKPDRILKLKYPDRAHDAEAIAVHPSGTLFLLTKEADYAKRRASAGILFQLNSKKVADPRGVEVLKRVGEIQIPFLFFMKGLFGRIATAMDISPDGKKLLILTYRGAIEILRDLSQGLDDSFKWKENTDYNLIDTEELPQQEAIAYGKTSDRIYYNTEASPMMNRIPLYELECVR